MTLARTGVRSHRLRVALLAATVLLGSFATWIASPSSAQDSGVSALVGSVSLDIAADPLMFVGLIDLTGFVQRDVNYVQGDTLIIGPLDHGSGAYRIDLPPAPMGPLNDVGNGQGAGPGVQIYSADPYWNPIGDERLQPEEFSGWPWANTSIVTEHGTHEVTGGRIVVWAPDDRQFFPTGFGADGRLFTSDDPVGPIPSGWTVVDLAESPFALNRSAEVDPLIGPGELTPVDLSLLPASEAFDEMVAVLRARYPFAKEIPIDWDALHAQYRPEFEAAELTGEQADFWIALNHFLIALNNWAYFAVFPWADHFSTLFLGATGLQVDVTDDDKVIVAFVKPGQAAAQAGIVAGAELLTWNGVPARQAVDDIPQIFTVSTAQNALAMKADHFGRLPAGTTVRVEFQNPGAAPAAADLTAVEIPGEDIGYEIRCFRTWKRCDDIHLPVWIEMLPSNIAVLHVNLFSLDVQEARLIVDAWDQALIQLNRRDVQGLILDLRPGDVMNWPGMPLYMAGSFFDEPFPLGDATAVDANGNDVTVATFTVRPAPQQWDRPVALLVNEWCKQSCEFFVQALTHRPGTIIAGMTATGGSLSGFTESILLPTGNFVLVVDAALRDPVTREILVEGKGIEPTLRVPKTAESILANVTEDVVLKAAEQALLDQIAAEATNP